MAEILVPVWLVVLVFLLVATAYSSVGLGGGSAYIALMVVFGFGSLSIPVVSLTLNIIVTTIGSITFIRRGYLRLYLLLPFLISSLPMAWLGGSLDVPKIIFQWLLLISLLVIVIRIYWWSGAKHRIHINRNLRFIISLLSGALLGLLAGILGMGGGIFLVPLILLLGLGTVKEAAACGAVFVWLNSLIGLASRLQFNFIDMTPYFPLIIAVIAGAVAGSFMGASRLSASVMEKVLGGVVIVAVFFLGKSMAYG